MGNMTNIRRCWTGIPYIALDKSSVLVMNRILPGLYDNIDFSTLCIHVLVYLCSTHPNEINPKE